MSTLMRDERGSLPLAMLVIMALSALMVVLVARTISAQRQVRFDREFTYALPIADAGLEVALFRLNNNDEFEDAATNQSHSRNDFPIGATSVEYSDSLSGDDFTWTITRETETRWVASSTGVVNDRDRVTVGTYQEMPLINVAAFTNDRLLLGGANIADSYNSDTLVWCTGQGIVASNDDVVFNGSSTASTACDRPTGRSVDRVHLYDWVANPGVNPTAARPGGSRCDNGGNHANCIYLNTAEGEFLAPLLIDERLDLATEQSLSFITDALDACLDDLGGAPLETWRASEQDTDFLTPADLAEDAVRQDDMALAGGHYCYDSMTFDADTGLDANATAENPVIIFVRNGVTITGGGNAGGATDVGCVGCQPLTSYPEAAALRIFVLEGPIALGNFAQFAGIMYGPRAVCGGTNNNAQAQIYGSLVCDSLENAGGWRFHYDEALANVGLGEFVFTNWYEEAAP